MNYNNYPAFGPDEKILILQNILYKHLGVESSVNFFGRVRRILSADGKSMTPEAFNSATEGTDVYYDDEKAPGGSVFFVDAEKHVGKSGKSMEATISVVFMLNLQKLFPNAAYSPDSEIQKKALSLVKRSGVLNDIGLNKGLKNVLEGFSLKEVRQNDIPPLHIFSVSGKMYYTNN